MLRASAQINDMAVDLNAVNQRELDPQLPLGSELLDFVDALIDRDEDRLADARQQLVAVAGPRAAARAALTCANFEMMNRILDSTGVPVTPSMGRISTELGLGHFAGR